MNSKKILFILGTRPEVIKMAPIIQAMQQDADFEPIVCATAQHRSMQDQMFKIFDIQPDIDLNIMKPNQDLFSLTGTLIEKLKDVFSEVQPDLVLAQGDTTTTFVASLAAYYSHVDVGHVEAGLRTYNPRHPFPEELNRTLTGRLAKFHFVPSEVSRANLLSERIADDDIYVTGNTVIDALLWVKSRINKETVLNEIPTDVVKIIQNESPYILITGHRRENFGEGFLSICRAIKQLSEDHPEYHFIYPVHLNPNVQKPVYDILKGYDNIHLIEPAGYETFVYLMDNSYLVLTDSGGVQEEAPSLGKPVLVMRHTTERPEGVDAGTAKLVGTEQQNIEDEVSHLIHNKQEYDRMANIANPYGDGSATEKIINILKKQLLS